jgi:hypothetical protein
MRHILRRERDVKEVELVLCWVRHGYLFLPSLYSGIEVVVSAASVYGEELEYVAPVYEL